MGRLALSKFSSSSISFSQNSRVKTGRENTLAAAVHNVKNCHKQYRAQALTLFFLEELCEALRASMVGLGIGHSTKEFWFQIAGLRWQRNPPA